MNRRDRVWAALAGEPVDRPPVSFWGHVYHRESSARDLVDATLEFQRAYDWDWVKLNPRKHYHVEPWDVRYRYSGRPGEKPVLRGRQRVHAQRRGLRRGAEPKPTQGVAIETGFLVGNNLPALAGAVLLIGINETGPFTILDGNHRLLAAMLAMPEAVDRLCAAAKARERPCKFS